MTENHGGVNAAKKQLAVYESHRKVYSGCGNWDCCMNQ